MKNLLPKYKKYVSEETNLYLQYIYQQRQAGQVAIVQCEQMFWINAYAIWIRFYSTSEKKSPRNSS